MEFSVPQFIERDPKIIGPFTLKQFIYIGTAGGIAMLLYFSVSFFYFIFFTALLGISAFALAFLKINGISFPTIIKNFLFFSVAPRIYLWKKTELPLYKKAVNKKIAQKKETREDSVLKVESDNNLKKLRSHIELGV